MHQIPKIEFFSSHLAVVFAQYTEARCEVENEDVVGAAPVGAAPTTSSFSTILLPTEVCIILEVLQQVPKPVWCLHAMDTKYMDLKITERFMGDSGARQWNYVVYLPISDDIPQMVGT